MNRKQFFLFVFSRVELDLIQLCTEKKVAEKIGILTKIAECQKIRRVKNSETSKCRKIFERKSL